MRGRPRFFRMTTFLSQTCGVSYNKAPLRSICPAALTASSRAASTSGSSTPMWSISVRSNHVLPVGGSRFSAARRPRGRSRRAPSRRCRWSGSLTAHGLRRAGRCGQFRRSRNPKEICNPRRAPAGGSLRAARKSRSRTAAVGYRLRRGCYCKTSSPGPNEPSGFILTTILGIVGAFVATYLGQAIGWYRTDEPRGCQ
jgi:hypothetical protein